tara:strand:- start:50 stop:613 length:564 start_codon:yes stop_codon:yes gene_type:complete
MKLPDIDIDLKNRDDVLTVLKHIPASITDDKKHNTGVYFNSIPVNPLTGYSTLDYKEAEERGYFKLDLLNVNLYKDIKDEKHLDMLMNKEPMWELLDHKEFVEQLFHIHEHYKIVSKLKPHTVEQLASILAIIRPSKRYLINENWETITKEVWIKPADNSYYFKKSHAIAYAIAVVVQMNLLVEQCG